MTSMRVVLGFEHPDYKLSQCDTIAQANYTSKQTQSHLLTPILNLAVLDYHSNLDHLRQCPPFSIYATLTILPISDPDTFVII